MDTVFITSRQTARAIGLKRFFDGIPCMRGHVCYKTTVNNQCRYCVKGDPSNPEEVARKRAEHTARAMARYNADKERHRAIAAKKYHESIAKNPEAIRSYTKKYWLDNRDRLSEKNKEWRDRNTGKLRTYSIKRKKSTKLRIPGWADLNAINLVYEKRKAVERETGIPHEVDHIIPLHGKMVCGLHVHYNLRVITTAENQAKRNNFYEELLNEHLSQ